MVFRFLYIILLLISFHSGFAQITTDPSLPVASQKVTITFNSAEESRLGYFTGDLYAHTGVNDWNYVIGDWGENDIQPKLTNKGNGIYELEITPDITTFYSVPAGEKVTKLDFVFRSADQSKQTNNLYVNVFEEGLIVNITEPDPNSIVLKNQPVTISAIASVESELKLYINETLLSQTTGETITANHTFSESGENWFIAEASANNETVYDSTYIYIREEAINESKPAAYIKGINYPSDTSAALVLWAPFKEFVFVLGDFNDWKPANNFQMKKDGDFFWLEIPDLEKGKEYIFQYFIEGEIKIADPYSEKTVNPWDDPYITSAVYPNLIQYPENKTDGVASVLQSGQEEFQWEITDFLVPEKEKLVIYELLIRDFTEEHTFKAVREKLDYLQDLNINVLELMPVNEFEQNSSWGYNTAYYFAPDKYYGPKDELKKLIDECHGRGIAVVIDMVLNHSYGQSPFVQMYMDNWTITAENPWFNIESPNQTFSWGYDFNHEKDEVKELVDSVNSFWINEYKVDGFRFDFTKGFTQTPGDGGSYDASRIAILKRMADEIRKRKSDALIILEHFADNNEEKELANYGMFLWGNMNARYRDAAKGNTGNSNLSWGLYSSRGWSVPNLVTYTESHDEERLMVECLDNGYSSGDYNIQEPTTALDRVELNSVFHIPLPGPKMIWQFGERGYDFSINAFGGRTNEKPPHWEYLENQDRTDLFKVMAQLNYLKQTYEEFSTENFSHNLVGEFKRYSLSDGNNHVVAAGNFGLQELNEILNFPVSGKYYEFFSGDSIQISTPQQNITLAAGEYKLYSTRKFGKPHIITDVEITLLLNDNFYIYPNPASNKITIQSEKEFSQISIYTLTGTLIERIPSLSENQKTIDVSHLTPGIYVVQILQDKSTSTKKLLIKK